MRYILLPVFLFFVAIAVCGQSKQYTYYFDQDLKTAKKETAYFTANGHYVNQSFEFKMYNVASGKLVIIQHFSDSSLKESEGLYQAFLPNGDLETLGTYVKNLEEGLWQRSDSSGHVIDSSYYTKGKINKYVHRGYYKGGFIDSIIKFDLPANELAKIYFSDSGKIANSVFFRGENGLETWYKDGILKSTDSVFSREEIEAAFPGGDAAWQQYMAKGLRKNIEDISRGNSFGTCVVKFIVSKDGHVTQVEATTLQGSNLAEVSVKIIKNSPVWHPASQYGRKVNAYRLQPVTVQKPD